MEWHDGFESARHAATAADIHLEELNSGDTLNITVGDVKHRAELEAEKIILKIHNFYSLLKRVVL